MGSVTALRVRIDGDGIFRLSPEYGGELTSTSSASRITIVLCLLAALCEGIDLQAAGVAAAGIGLEFRPAPDVLGTFFAASTLGLFIGAMLGGHMADRIGRRFVLIYSVVSFGLFSLLTAMAWDMRALTWARFFTGLGLGGALPMVMTMVPEASTAGRRAANVAVAFAGLPIGGVIVSAIALSTGPAQWQLIFIIGGILPLALALAMLILLKESPEFTVLQAANQSTSGTSAQAGRFMQIMAQGRASRTTLLWISFFLALIILYLLLNWLPTLLRDNGMTRQQAAFAQITFNVGGAVAALSMGRLLVSRWRMPSLVATFIGVPVMLYALSTIGGEFLVASLVVFLLGLAVLSLQAFLYSTAPASYPTWIRGAGVGAAIAVGRLGSIVGPKLGGWLKGLGHGSSQLVLDLLPIAIIGSVFALILALTIRKHREC
jgi:AAHS family 3-hydroxyphenylpropionic acid transporter